MKKQFFFETIKIQYGKINNLKYHNIRINKTRKDIFYQTNTINLENFLKPIKTNNIIKCRVLYKENIHSITYTSYTKKNISSFLIINNENIHYPYKSNNRKDINKLLQNTHYDEIFIFKNKLLTDTSIANIAILQDNIWITPKTPLLKGTMRESMLNNSLLKSADITIEILKSAKKIALLNAMIGFYIIDDFIIKDL
jgi:4-amino-4-deoxychorismate lyase